MATSLPRSHLLLVDGDPKSLRVLDVSLKKAGFDVTTATSGAEALAILDSNSPDLIISDTDLGEMDGFELCKQIKERVEWARIPFLFISGRKSIEDKIRGLELGVEDYLTKPIYIKEIGIRVRTALQRADRDRMESRRDGRTRFAGDLADVGVVDLVQTIELNRKSGIIHLVNRDGRRGAIFFRDGKIIDSEAGRLTGANALYRLFTWSEGHFAVEFKQIRRYDIVDMPMAALLMEGMRRIDESARLFETLPPPRSLVEVDCSALAQRLADLPDAMNSILRLCDGTRTLQEVVENSDQPDLEALSLLQRLHETKVIVSRETSERIGNPEPAQRLARWLSEGDLGDGAAAEDGTAPAEYDMPLALPSDSDVAPRGTPAPTPRRDSAPSDNCPFAPSAAETSAQGAGPLLSGEETLEAVLAANVTIVDCSSGELGPTPETLRGIPFEGLFGEKDSNPDPVKNHMASVPATDSEVAGSLNGSTSTTQPHGLAERLLSEDSALRDSVLAETEPQDSAKVQSLSQTERTTQEYGKSQSKPAAALLRQIVSLAHEADNPADLRPEPERPNKEVDWGKWAADLRLAENPELASGSGLFSPGVHPEPGRDAIAQRAAKGRLSRALWPVALAFLVLGATVAFAVIGPWASSRAKPLHLASPSSQPAVLGLPIDASMRSVQSLAESSVMAPSVMGTEKKPPAHFPAETAAAGFTGGGSRGGKEHPTGLSELRTACMRADADGQGKAQIVSAACRPVLALDPKNSDILAILARAELDRGKIGEARTLARKLITTDPRRFEAYVLLGNAEQEAGKVDEARAAYKKYLELAPNGPYSRELRAILTNL